MYVISAGLEDYEELAGPSQTSPVRKRTMMRCTVFIILLTLLACCMLLWDRRAKEEFVLSEEVARKKQSKTLSQVSSDDDEPERGAPGDTKLRCTTMCKEKQQERREHHGGDLLSNVELLDLVEDQRNEAIRDLKQKYGPNFFRDLFMPNGGLRPVFTAATKSGKSRTRLVRKLQIKLLTVQAALFESSLLEEDCDCLAAESATAEDTRLLEERADKVGPESYLSRFVWATGGHSAAAGHGNLFNESYTAFLESISKPVFQSVGIDFEGRNYAMGGMKSAPTIALCNEAIFGTDADVISWDYGMTDGRGFHYKALFDNRAGVHRNRPAIVDVNVMGQVLGPRIDELKAVEENGLTAFYMNQKELDKMYQKIPDMFGLDQSRIDTLPEFIRHFRCQGHIEKGFPTCQDEKYSKMLCPKRPKQVSWHPGWKVNAMAGFTLGLFLIDVLIEAVHTLGPSGYNPANKLGELKAQEDKDYNDFFRSRIDSESERVTGFFNSTLSSAFDPNLFFRERVICHTSLLPARTRYEGFLTESSISDFDRGVSHEEADRSAANGKLRLAFDPESRVPTCPVPLMIDFKDHFYANANDDWVSLVFPNKAELKAYGPFQPKGLLTICFVLCDWGKCPPGDLQMDAVNQGLLQISINDIPVHRVWPIANECGVLQGSEGWTFPTSKDGQYKVAVKVSSDGQGTLAYTRITAIVAL